MCGLRAWQKTRLEREANVFVKNFGLYPKSEKESLNSLKQRGGMIDHPFSVENGLNRFFWADLHWCLWMVFVKGKFSPQPALN